MALMAIVKILCLATFTAIQLLCSASFASKSSNASKELDSNNYACEWSYFRLNSSLVAFSINHLSLADDDKSCPSSEQVANSFLEGYGSIQACEFSLRELNASASSEQLLAMGLQPELPFIFYINGFNTFNRHGEVNGTWMYNVAKMFAQRGLQNRHNGIRPELGANIIFLTWGIPDIVAESALSIVPAYFKTISNYEQILSFVAQTISQLVKFVDESHSQWRSQAQRRAHFASFQFFGHSLGSHIIADAIERALRPEPRESSLTFGKLTGLDPALPCFLSLGRDKSGMRRAASSRVQQLVVMHSNAGLAGLASERANVEIVLNGGTFQPGCSWFDFVCHHQRATAILGYMDDRCQMVAYKCSSYNHFKSGACETCEFRATSHQPGRRQSDSDGPNCVLVNMPEQHVDNERSLEFVLARAGRKHSRQLIDDGQDLELGAIIEKSARLVSKSPLGYSNSPNLRQATIAAEKLNSAAETGDESRTRGSRPLSYYHYVNTSPNFRSGRKTHCLQHYQLRTMILQDDIRAKQKCPISSFLSDGSILMRLFHNQSSAHQQSGGIGWRKRMRSNDSSPTLKWSPTIRLDKIIKDSLYTSLLNFEGSPELFVGAELNNLQLDKLNRCLSSNNATDSPNFVLDIAFMSHTDYRFRRAFSSILCGQTPRPGHLVRTANSNSTNLLLRLCKSSELVNVSRQIDNVLDHIEQQRLNDSWQVSLLNSLFSLFAEWEPF